MRFWKAAVVAIAVALWVQLALQLESVVTEPVHAQFRQFQASDIQAIRRAVEAIESGRCQNSKVC